MFIDNFEKICKSKNLKPTPVLKNCGISPSTATNWQEKRTIIPDGKTIILLAEYLKCSTDFLLLGKEHAITPEQQELLNNFDKLTYENKLRVTERITALLEAQPKENNSIYKPIYSSKVDYITVKHGKNKVSAGKGFELPESNRDDEEYIKVPDTWEAQYCDYALTVEGDSMYPFFKNNDIVFVKNQPQIEVGQIGIFIIDNELAYIKKLGTDKLISLNEEFDDIPFVEGKDIICKGLVIGKV